MTVALIVNNRVHQILRDQTEIPEWPPFPEAFPEQPIEERTPLLVKAPDNVQVGWLHDPKTGQVKPMPERPGDSPFWDFDEDKMEWVIKEAAKQQHEIFEFKQELEQIDLKAGASRAIRNITIDMGAMLGAFRAASMDFGAAIEFLGQTNPDLAEHFDKTKNIALQKIEQLDPSEHQGLQRITELEHQAEEIRERLRPLLDLTE